MESQKKSKFGLGLLIGSFIGGVIALFFAPKSGKELRNDIKEKIKELKKLLKEKEIDKKAKAMIQEFSEEARVWYNKANGWLIEELALLKKKIEEINWQDYQKAVAKIIARLKKEAKKEIKEINLIRKKLLKDWQKIKTTNQKKQS